MVHGFDDYRVYVSAPGDMERDRQACYDAISQADEETAMPAKILLVSVGLRENSQIDGSRSIVSDNVRWSSYFIQLFQDDWGPRELFRKLFLLATECRDDPGMPMREVVLCLKGAPHETDERVLAWRKELEERTDLRVIRYHRPEELQSRVAEVCAEWVQALTAARGGIERVSDG
jgi:hypothetical protein